MAWRVLLAFNLSSFPVNVISTSIRRVLVPAFARFQGDHTALREVFLRWLHQLALPTVLCAPCCHAGPSHYRVVYGSKWRDPRRCCVPGRVGGARVVIEFIYDVFVAVGRSRPLLWLQGRGWSSSYPRSRPAHASTGSAGGARARAGRGVGRAAGVRVGAPPLGMGVGDVAAQFARPLLGAAGAGAVVCSSCTSGRGLRRARAGGRGDRRRLRGPGATPAELRSLPRLVRRRGVEVAPAE